jgi:hydrogenase maturation protease
VGEVLLIGYGNDLRRDDAAGRYVAAAFEQRSLEGVLHGVIVRSIPQLLPELTTEIGAASRVIFVDAKLGGGAVTTEPVVPTTGPPRSHIGSPGDLLSLMEGLTLDHPPAFLVTVPAFDFSVGEGLSEPGTAAVNEAIDQVGKLIDRLRQ